MADLIRELAPLKYGAGISDILGEIGASIREGRNLNEAKQVLSDLTGIDITTPEGKKNFADSIFKLSQLGEAGKRGIEAVQPAIVQPIQMEEALRAKRFNEFKNVIAPVERDISLYQQRALLGSSSETDIPQLEQRIKNVGQQYPEFANQLPSVPRISPKFGTKALETPNEWFVAGQGLHPDIKNPDDILGYAQAYEKWYQGQEKLRVASSGMPGEGWKDVPQEDKDFYYELFISDKSSTPPFAWRDRESRTEWAKGVAEYARRTGRAPADVYAQRAEKDALTLSLKNQERIYGAMGQFVGNINLQVGRVKEIMKDVIDRVGTRALDLPRREWLTRFQGSGHEKVLESYLLEISSEIGKLSTGSQASIAELSVSARERWDRIHDPNLSLKELSEVLQATKEQALYRQKSAKDNIDETNKRIREIGISTGKEPPSKSEFDKYKRKP